MPTATEPFDLAVTVHLVLNALSAVVCNIGFQFAMMGLLVALVIGVMAIVCLSRGKKTGKPLLSVSRKISIFCGCLSIPGAISLITQGSLPQVNQLVLNPFGLLGFWGLITAHLCMEEMNFQWFVEK